MKENQLDEEEEFDIEDFLTTLSIKDFNKLLCAETITTNNNIIKNTLESASNANLNSENTDLIISGDVKHSLFLILPETKGLSRENRNKIKDIECFKKAYENEGKEINITIDKIKNHFSELSQSTKDLLDYIQKVYEHHSNDAKEMVKPITQKKKGLDQVDEKKLPNEDKQSFINKKQAFNESFSNYDKKLSDTLNKLKTILNSIDTKIQTFSSTMDSMASPINELIEHVNEIFGEFEEKSKNIIEILKNNNLSKEENEEIKSIFEDIKKYNPTIINLLKEKEDFLDGVKYHGLEGFDKYPDGDKKYDIIKIVEGYAKKNISLMCLNITDKTVNLYNNFVDYYQKGRKNNLSASIYVDNFNRKPEELSEIIEKSANEIYEKRHDNN